MPAQTYAEWRAAILATLGEGAPCAPLCPELVPFIHDSLNSRGAQYDHVA